MTDHRHPIDALGALLVGELERAELLRRQVEHRMNAPQPTVLARRLAGLAHRGGVHQPDQPPSRNATPRVGRSLRQQPRQDALEPRHGVAQSPEHGHVRQARQPNGFRPCRRQPQSSHKAEAIGKDQSQQVDTTLHLARSPEGTRRARLLLQKPGSAETLHGADPIRSSQLCMGHPHARI
jgi:hypothetical protein